MRDFEEGDKVLCVTGYTDDDDIKEGDIIEVKNYYSNGNFSQVGSIFNLRTDRFILAETDSIDRAIEHIQKGMWVDNGDTIKKITTIDLSGQKFAGLASHFYSDEWIADENITKIYFYDPSINKQQEELKANIARIEKELDDMKSKLS